MREDRKGGRPDPVTADHSPTDHHHLSSTPASPLPQHFATPFDPPGLGPTDDWQQTAAHFPGTIHSLNLGNGCPLV